MLSILLSFLTIILVFLYLRKHPSKWVSAIILVLFNWLILEIGLYFYLLWVVHSGNFLFLIGNQKILDSLIKRDIIDCTVTHKNASNSFYQIDPDLGYTVGKNQNFWLYRSNPQGLRADTVYSQTPSPTTLRMATLGDSFVFGDGEPNAGSWPYILQNITDGLEVLNFGVSGYGLSQSYLRYLKDAQSFHPDIVFINYVYLSDRDWLEGDLFGGRRLRQSTFYRPLLNVRNGHIHSLRFSALDLLDPTLRNEYLYKPMGLEHSFFFSWAKPFFSWTNTGLVIKDIYLEKKFDQALTNEGKNPLEKNKRLAYTLILLEDFLNETLKHHSMVIFFFDQDFDQLPAPIQTILQQHSQYVVYLNGKKLLDLFFKKLNLQPSDYLNHTSHYNALGNRIYAQIVQDFLETNHWGGAGRYFLYCDKTNRFQNVALQACE